MDAAVDLVINTFERSYRTVLSLGFFPKIEAQNRRPMTARVALINNVRDPDDAVRCAQRLVTAGEIDAYYRVEDELGGALAVTGLTRADLGRVPHFSDCALVAVTLAGSPWLLYWDAEASLEDPCDWVSPAIELMGSDPRILAASPRWPGYRSERDARATHGIFDLGYGFSDQLFLARRADLAAPIYGHRCIASWRYPMAHVTPIFEARVDAYMRRHRRLRAVHREAGYLHAPREASTVEPEGICERVRLWRNRAAVKLLRHFPLEDPRWSLR